MKTNLINVLKAIKKHFLISALVLTGVFVVTHFVWNGSGSSEWEFMDEKDGIKMWSLKSPGNNLLKGRAKFRVKTTLGGIATVIYDPDVLRNEVMMKDIRLIADTRKPGYYSVFNTFTQEMPFPFTRREFVLLSQHVQDPVTKVIEFNAMAAPYRIPPSDCCVRLVHIHNRYTLTPLSTGEVEIEFLWDLDLGGAIPYFLKNLMLPEALYSAMNDFRALILKHNTATLDYISELESTI